jgi:hypothetical protein
MRYLTKALGFSTLFLAALSCARGDDVLLVVDPPPADGLVVAPVDLTGAARWGKIDAVSPDGIRAFAGKGNEAAPFQFVPDVDFDARERIAGTVVLELPQGSDGRVRLRFTSAQPGKPAPPAATAQEQAWDGTVTTPAFTVKHDPKKQGGLPSAITFTATGKRFDNFRWNDRVYDRDKGWFGLANDPRPSVERVAEGTLCTVVRVRARYMKSADEAPASKPEAVYDWLYFHDRPLVYVRAAMSQQEAFAWPEHHFLELDYPQETFPRWAGGEPLEQGEFTASQKSHRFSQWGAVVDGPNAIGMFGCGQALVYEGGGGTYLHAHGAAAWSGWRDERPQLSAWMWIASQDAPIPAIQSAASQRAQSPRVAVTTDELRARIQAARERSDWRCAAAAGALEAAGRLEEAGQAAAGQLPPNWHSLAAGKLGLLVERTSEGARLVNLLDLATGQELLAPASLPLFTLTMRDAETKEEVRLNADSGWGEVEIVSPGGPGVEIRWRRPKDQRLGDLSVLVKLRPDDPRDALGCSLTVENPSDRWSVWHAVFPQVAVADGGPESKVFFPRGAGEVQQNVCQRAFRYSGTYPSGWTSMQFMAAYTAEPETGLYVAVHDPWGSTKDLRVEGRPADRAVVLAFDHPAPDMGVAGNDFDLAGEAVVQLLHGDWFDAAVTYRDFVRKEAKWYPKLTAEGREDTPLWMRELCCWAQTGGAPDECVEAVKEFQKFMGVPVGFHWYSWHQIPFDNDYPHYFPTKKGFAEAVKELQASNVYVMPYINGRLWDTRDKGLDDFQFTSVARAAATKQEDGEPYTEMYGSKESDGSRVKLAVMCPTTDVWQNTVREIVLRLMNECGTSAVYIDQVAAAQPRLCFDKSHGHPLGGGHWWTPGYWKLIGRIQQEMPKDRMLTTECNAEPYARVFDGYLTWHWQYDGQVPAFPAVYGGAIQMFGRAYRGGPTKDLALRMKAGQQLVYGEQIGWLSPGVVHEKENAEFFRQVVRLRHQLRRYFYAGEMARPPRLVGEIPRVTADWQWSGQWPVTTDAVMAGAWAIPKENRLVLVFVNVGDEPVSAKLDLDAAAYGLGGEKLRVVKVTAEGEQESFSTAPALQRDLTFPARATWAWEMKAE